MNLFKAVKKPLGSDVMCMKVKLIYMCVVVVVVVSEERLHGAHYH